MIDLEKTRRFVSKEDQRLANLYNVAMMSGVQIDASESERDFVSGLAHTASTLASKIGNACLPPVSNDVFPVAQITLSISEAMILDAGRVMADQTLTFAR